MLPWLTDEGNFTLTDAFWSLSIAAMHDGDARASIEVRPKDPAGFLAGDGIPITSEMLGHAKSALAYQPWRTVWESAKAIVETTGRPEYVAMSQRVFTRVPVHLIAGEGTVGGWDVPAWARKTARTDTVLPGVGHMMMLERPADLGQVLATVLT